MHMIKVLKQNVMIPKVPRCFGSPIHKYGGLLGVVVLVAGFSILWDNDDNSAKNEERGVCTAMRASRHLYASVLYALHIRCAKVPLSRK